MVFKGVAVFISTSRLVQGSEFGMLGTLAHEISLLMARLALFALRPLLPDAPGSSRLGADGQPGRYLFEITGLEVRRTIEALKQAVL